MLPNRLRYNQLLRIGKKGISLMRGIFVFLSILSAFTYIVPLVKRSVFALQPYSKTSANGFRFVNTAGIVRLILASSINYIERENSGWSGIQDLYIYCNIEQNVRRIYYIKWFVGGDDFGKR